MTTTFANVGTMPKSLATYYEYRLFLLKYRLTLEKHFGHSKNPLVIKRREEAVIILDELAENNHVNTPTVIIASGAEEIDLFTSSQEAVAEVVKFLGYFRNTHWNEMDKQNVKRLNAILMLSIFQF